MINELNVSSGKIEHIISLLGKAGKQGISIFLKEGKLMISTVKDVTIEPSFLELIKSHKDEIKAFLSTESDRFQDNALREKIAPISRVPGYKLPLSFTQEDLWFIDQFESSSHYHIPLVLRLKGAVATETMGDALNMIVNRHESLRTVFMESDGRPYQELLPEDSWKLSIDGDQQPGELNHYLHSFIRQPFDLGRDHMLRAAICPVGPDEYLLSLVIHHIACDGWSIPLLVQELKEIYTAKIAGNLPVLNELKLQYTDYAVWQRQTFTAENIEDKLTYWQKQLKNLSTLKLPTDFPRPAEQSSNGMKLFLKTDAVLTEKLRVLARKQGVSMNMLLLSAFNVLLYRHTNQTDIAVGTPVANRALPELDTLIGFFVNTVVMRTKLSGEMTFEELLNEVKTLTLQAYQNQDVPFAKVVRKIQQQRDKSRSPLFQVMFVFQHQENMQDLLIGNLDCSAEPYAYPVSRFDLTLSVNELPDDLQFVLEYCTDLFLPSTIENMGQHYLQLLSSICEKTDVPIGKLEMLSSAEKNQLLSAFNDTRISFSKTETVIDLFQQQAEIVPDAIAVVYEQAILSYKDLHLLTNQFANYLLANKSFKKDSLVAVKLPRSEWLITAIMAILKAGAAYVPIDPDFPEERIAYILSDSQCEIIIDDSVIRDFVARKNKFSEEKPGIVTHQSDLAYIIYTSGTTGKPKGVMIEHGGIYNLAAGQIRILKLNTEDHVLQFAAATFDIFCAELFSTLGAGAKLCIPTRSTQLSMDDMKDFIRKYEITIATIPPSYQVLLIDHLFSLKTIISAGEVINIKLTALLQEKGVTVINGYGPTESSVYITMSDHPIIDGYKSTIGKPLDNVKIYILDENNQPAPIGVTGELCTGGIQVARGYLNRPELTAERFIPNPFESEKADCPVLYRTGDLAKWLPDGNIEYVGRIDHQVKIRGYRIELGEIEAALERYETINQAVVKIHADEQENKKIVAYVIADTEWHESALYDHLKSILPQYMLPSLYIRMAEFPLTSSNKIDRSALPDPNLSSLLTKGYAAPTNPIEEKLAMLWCQLLNIKEVGIHTNFFELGGDSIIAIQFVSRAKEAGLIFRVKDVFDYQTISRLAEQLNQNSLIWSEQGRLAGSASLLPIQKYFFEADFRNVNHFNQSLLLNLNKSVDSASLAACLDQLINQHDALRFRYTFSENEAPIQSYGDYMPVPDINDLSDSIKFSYDVSELCEFYHQKLSVTEGILVRMVFIKSPDEEEFNRLFLVVHHLAVDGVSWRIIVDDLCVMLRKIALGKRINPRSKTTSYRQWGKLLHDYAESPVLRDEFAYWKGILEEFEPLPAGSPANSLTPGYASIKLKFFGSQTQRLLHQANQAYHTEINDLLLCALTLVICEWAERSEFVLALEGHGRESLFENADLSKTVGWFTTIFPVKLFKEGGESLSAFIIRLKEQIRNIPNKGIGYGVLRYLSGNAEIEEFLHADFGQLIFNYLGNFDAAMNGNEFVSLASEYAGKNNSPDNHNLNAMEVSINIAEGHLNLVWSYDTSLYDDSVVEFLVSRYSDYLNEIIDHCCSIDIPVKTPSDYGLDKVTDYPAFDAFIKEKPELEDIYKLSPLQSGILFHSLYQEDSAAYIVQFACDFVNGLGIGDFENAWKQLIARHSILRTVFFYNVFDEPVQCVFQNAKLPLNIVDYSSLKGEVLEEALNNFLKEDSQQPFDLEHPPLMRISLILLAEGRVKMVWTNHHIILDGWSMSVLIKEFLILYKQFRSGESLSGSFRVDYFKDLIMHQAKISKTDAAKHWSHYLAGLESPTLIPFIHQTALRNKQLGNQLTPFVAGKDLAQGLEDFAKRNHLTLNTIIQGAWAYLLSRYTGTSRIVFGTTVSGRVAEIHDVEDRVGLYINTIPVCITVENDSNIINWLATIQEEHAVSREYSHTPLSDIRAITGFDEDFFDSLLVFENYPVSSITEAETDLKIENIHNKEQTHYSLLLCVTTGETIAIDFNYHTELLAPETVQMMITHLTMLFESIVNPRNEKIADLHYMDAAEEEKLLSGFNHSTVSYPLSASVTGCFEEQVNLCPDRIALVDNDLELSYRELDRLSNRLAHVLRTHGVGRNSIVGLLTGRSHETVIGMLGILKAGGAYLPMDLDYPADRISYLLDDSKAVLLLVTSAGYKVAHGIETLVVQDVLGQEESTDERLPLVNQPEDLCYVIYTSGTTGYPKGVLVEHRNVVRLFFHEDPLFDFGAEDVWTMFHNPYFDFSVWEMYGALLYGGKLVMVSKMVARDPSAYLSLLVKQGVTVLNQTPSAFYNLIAAESASGLAPGALRLRYIIFGGEALKPLKLADWYAKYSDILLVNMFGITETTVHVTYKLITAEDIRGNVSNIGVPIPTLSAYIFDGSRRLVARGVSGELYVGGAGVSRGYLNRPELTASRFVDNPYRAGERLYRTGDLCRQGPNGELEYIGRIDHQVKIRGHRIELGEIEGRLLEHELVSDAVVIVREDDGNNLSLCAYLVGLQEIDLSGIRAYLSGLLPDYMVPSHSVQVDFIPQTVNGKVDRKALPAPVYHGDGLYVAPGRAADIALCRIWSSVLQVDEVGLNSNFFSLGGDSMLALKLVSRINRELGLKMSIADLFTYQSVAELGPRLVPVSALVEEEDAVEELLSAYAGLRLSFLASNPSLDASMVTAVYPASDIQKGMLYHSMKERGLYHDQMVHVVRYPDAYLSLLDHALALLIDKHSILRTGFYQGDGAELLQVVFSQGVADIRHHDLCSLSVPAQQAFIREALERDRDEPFGLGLSGLFRLLVFRLGDGRSCLCLVCHHAIIDGWSEASFNTELHNTLVSLSSDPGFRPSGLAHSYLDFVIDQELASRDAVLRSYWQDELKGYKRFSFSSVEEELVYRTHYSRLDESLLAGLNAWNHSSGVSVRALCFSAFVYGLYMLSYDNDLTVGMVTNNRPALEDGDKILGCFLNTVPFRVTVPGEGSWLSFVEGINTKLNGQKAYERLSFSKIVSALKESAGEQNPITDVLFNYVDFHVYDALEHEELSDGGGSALSEQEGADGGEAVMGETRNNSLFNLNVDRTGGGLNLSLCYQSNFVSGDMVERFMVYYHRILELMLREPEGGIGIGAVLGSGEQEALLYGFNATEVAYPDELTILDLFSRQAGKTPDAVALRDEEQVMSYAELDQRSNQIANYLKNHEIIPEKLVPVYMDRSAELIIVLLGVMKAGCAYIPIDPSHPKERIEYILNDIDAPLVISANGTAAAFEGSSIKVINIDQVEDKIRKEANHLETRLPDSKELVYIMYTSGTTGKPKGVMITHRALYNFISSMTSLLGAGQNDLFLSLTTFSFDISCLEFYLPLCTGGQVAIASTKALSDPQILIAEIEKLRPDFVQATPSRWQLLLDAGWKNNRKTKILSGGEALTDKLKDQLVLTANQAIWNLYGPTETTIWSSAAQLHLKERVNIGKPIANTRLYILDKEMNLLPIGVNGDLYIGGDGLSQGYYRKPALTSEKFINYRFSKDKEELIYKTGDIGKWLSTGEVQLSGRADNQIKIDGYRMEAGEIEYQLLALNQLKEAVVMAKEHNGSKLLVAYLVSSGEIEDEEIRTQLLKALPIYMVPSLFIRLNEMPQTANGKIDRKLLPEPVLFFSGSRKHFSPIDETEEKLVLIWGEILNVDPALISTDRNFFEMGGNSIKAVHLMIGIQKEFSNKIELREVFAYNSISKLAKLLRENLAKDDLGIQILINEGPFPASSAQERLFYQYLSHKESLAYNISGAYFLEGQTDLLKIGKVLQLLTDRHESLKTNFLMTVDGLRQQINKDAPTGLTFLEADNIEEGFAKFIKPFDLLEGPLVRFGLLNLKDGVKALLFDVHHIVADGISLNILMQDFKHIFLGNPLEKLKYRYIDYAAWQQSSNSALLKQKEFWKNTLSGDLPLVALAENSNDFEGGTEAAKIQVLTVDQELYRKAKEFSVAANVSEFMLLLSVYYILIYKMSDQADLIIGSDSIGRTDSDLQHVVGTFVNILPLRIHLNEGEQYIEFLHRVREVVLNAFENQDFQFDDMVSMINSGNSTPKPLVNIHFAFANYMEGKADFELDGQKFKSAHIEREKTTQYDFKLEVTELNDQFRIEFIYNEEVYEDEMIAVLLNYYQTILSIVIENCQLSIGNIEL